ncbi:hypothetical protein EMIHUDRAFT_415073 [Emiliania huxleyi CCMP1516]|uniref:EIPR1-like beta-propeller domain-containing protein n=3 Tax=Emiliania huxleyi TaxID=2903 RepID=A0A0D3KHZ3_EMIH1|nr:hypothetical protein EMIHUDRAFT_415073 [Emiliania huxleyi CCMP1516]EOD35378.1 hypothetical protein EMIHUDRAFT_415073 [Emiliania huxleyi CCMP1516]|eukprot:XP_005787807.1 hypothetical protein EMIHUDRAFT_415073 [Emiliania huxleyi CCMP1516]
MDRLAEREAAPEAGHRGAPAPAPLAELLQLGGPCALGDSVDVLWNPVLPEQVASLHRGTVRLWSLSHAAAASSASESGAAPSPREEGSFGCGRWDPHHAHALALACESDLLTLDTRSMKSAVAVADAHEQPVRGLDYNPNKPNTLLSSGDDYHVKVWDLRKPLTPVLSLLAHAHWVTSATYNRFHDQLLLSCGTDSQVKLWRAAAISSAPPSLDYEEADPSEVEADGIVRPYTDHEQSVFGAVWSAADAWIFASLSLDGKVVVNHVPPSEKYKILL